MKLFWSLFLFIFCTTVLVAQNSDNEYGEETEEVEEFKGLKDEKKKIDLSRFRVGGDFAFSAGGQGVFIAEISPVIGYQIIKDILEVGPGIVYQHRSKSKYYKENNIGGQAYVRAYIWNGIFAQLEGFLVNFNYEYVGTPYKAKFTYGNGFVGAGYAINYKEAPFYLSISVKTNLVTDKYYPKRTLVPQIGFQFRL